jgi:hypothetical protein
MKVKSPFACSHPNGFAGRPEGGEEIGGRVPAEEGGELGLPDDFGFVDL